MRAIIDVSDDQLAKLDEISMDVDLPRADIIRFALSEFTKKYSSANQSHEQVSCVV